MLREEIAAAREKAQAARREKAAKKAKEMAEKAAKLAKKLKRRAMSHEEKLVEARERMARIRGGSTAGDNGERMRNTYTNEQQVKSAETERWGRRSGAVNQKRKEKYALKKAIIAKKKGKKVKAR